MVIYLEYVSAGPWVTLRVAQPTGLPAAVDMFYLHCPAKPPLGTCYLHMQTSASST